jgi:hypothetical protein
MVADEDAEEEEGEGEGGGGEGEVRSPTRPLRIASLPSLKSLTYLKRGNASLLNKLSTCALSPKNASSASCPCPCP